MSRAALDSAVLEWMREPLWGHDDERFEELALALFAHQFANCAPYERFCRGRGHTPETVPSWRQVPAVPTGAFKELALRSFPAEDEIRVFRTSGSSGEKRGEHGGGSGFHGGARRRTEGQMWGFRFENH